MGEESPGLVALVTMFQFPLGRRDGRMTAAEFMRTRGTYNGLVEMNGPEMLSGPVRAGIAVMVLQACLDARLGQVAALDGVEVRRLDDDNSRKDEFSHGVGF